MHDLLKVGDELQWSQERSLEAWVWEQLAFFRFKGWDGTVCGIAGDNLPPLSVSWGEIVGVSWDQGWYLWENREILVSYVQLQGFSPHLSPWPDEQIRRLEKFGGRFFASVKEKAKKHNHDVLPGLLGRSRLLGGKQKRYRHFSWTYVPQLSVQEVCDFVRGTESQLFQLGLSKRPKVWSSRHILWKNLLHSLSSQEGWLTPGPLATPLCFWEGEVVVVEVDQAPKVRIFWRE